MTLSTAVPRRLLLLACVALLASCAGTPTPPSAPAAAPAATPAARQALAPTGTLRVAVYPGSPTSLVRQVDGGEPMRGLAVEVGQALARQLGVPVAVVVLPRVAEVVAALQKGDADVTITNATAERARLIDFTEPLVSLELGVLVRDGVALDPAALDRSGLRLGVSQGSSSERVLGARLRQTALVPQPTLQAAAAALWEGRIDAFATNKAILFELQDRLGNGFRVADGRWGLEHLALATGPGRGEGLQHLRRYAQALRGDPLLQAAAARAGLRGLAPAGTAAEAR